MKKKIQNSCLWSVFVIIFALCAILGSLFLTIYGILALTTGVVNATMLWTGFGLFWGGKVFVSILEGIDKFLEEMD